MDEKTFKARTKKLAVAIIKQVDKLPRSLASDVIARQILRSGTSMNQIADIYKETDEILAMTIASIKTLRNRPQSKIVNPKS
jgi:hypothetical protein